MTENLKDLYNKMEQETLNSTPRGDKAQRFRDFAMKVKEQTGKTKLSVGTLYKIAKQSKEFEDIKVERSHFVGSFKPWKQEKSENGNIFVYPGVPAPVAAKEAKEVK